MDDDGKDAIKELSEKCYEKVSSKALEINLIVLHSILLVLYIICFSVVNMSVYAGYGLLYFFILAPMFINLVFSIALRYWRVKNVIKTIRKKRGSNIALTGFIFTAIFYFFAMISAKIITTDSETDIKENCLKYNNSSNCPHEYDSTVFYVTFSLTEIISIPIFYVWLYLRERIKKEEDKPPSFIDDGTQTTDEPIESETNSSKQKNAVKIYRDETVRNNNIRKSNNNNIETIDSKEVIV